MITPATHRGVCNRCRRDFALREDGLLRGHDRVINDAGDREPCPGSFRQPRVNTVAKVRRIHVPSRTRAVA